MILISHRGNTNGKFVEFENSPNYIDESIREGYDVEIDVWCLNNGIFLGHDYGQYEVSFDWFEKRKSKLWIHCKNHNALEFFNKTNLHYFWHDVDDLTLTSNGILWSHPKIKPLINSIAVMPEINNWEVKDLLGICSDYIGRYKKNESK